ncbi:MAG: membrane dipeptidase [Deltaproteobacteria bacterium]|nr:membrane dipeptidase [Deltaproteobacteria bacterium]
MTIRRYPPILDGHNDSLIKLYLSGYKGHKAFLNGGGKNHLDLPRIKHGGFGGGFFAVFVPSDDEPPEHPGANLNDNGISYDIPLTKPVNPARALEMTIIEMAALFRLADESNGKIKLNALYVFAEAGLRSVGITWSRSNAFGFGVPFKFPQSPDTGPGLTDIGVRLVKACNSLGIIVDLAHINEQGFWDTARITQAPLVVTHTGVHAICPSSRNLTDKQLDAVGESGGVVGINFHVGFLRADGRLNPDTPIHEIVRHICYVADKIGIDHVAFGSDFDGATIPKDLKDVAGLPKLMSALEKAGFDDEALVKISHENWIRIFKQTWKDQNCQ